jgi:hypothetical protein
MSPQPGTLWAQSGWQLINMLSWWQWAVLAAVPPAIVALYFLKLKRHPLEVPSTYLWHRSIEDLHVNTIWQRLRRNLLLWLQLLLVLLAMLALLRPGWRGENVSGERFIVLIDNSASMQATDVAPSRLDEAKRRARAIVEQMTARDVAMIVSFADADSARVRQMFTSSRRRLLDAIDSIEPTPRRTSLAEALKFASGLANPGRTADDPGDFLVAEPLPATLYVFSDGNFPPVADFRLGNLTPVYVAIGSDEAANVAIAAFNVRRHETDPAALQAFARVENFGLADATVSLELRRDGELIDADRVDVALDKPTGVAFPLGAVESGVLELRAAGNDHLRCDDVAWAVINPPSRGSVLLVTPGNRVLESALSTSTVRDVAEVRVEAPGYLESESYAEQAALGAHDLVIYDRCRPTTPPRANTWFIGTLPPAPGSDARQAGPAPPPAAPDASAPPTAWQARAKTRLPVIIDVEANHPLMHSVNMDGVAIAEASPLAIPQGGTVLIDSDAGPLMAIAPRDEFEDAVAGFVLIGSASDEQGPATFLGTNWWCKASFTVFVLHLLDYLGGAAAPTPAALQPGQPIALDAVAPGRTIRVRTPSGAVVELNETRPGKYHFTGTSELGVYEVRDGDKMLDRFAVNLVDASESAIRPRRDIQIGRGTPIAAQAAGWEIARRELWKWLLLAGLAVLLVEWYVYHRRVHW